MSFLDTETLENAKELISENPGTSLNDTREEFHFKTFFISGKRNDLMV